MQLNKLPNKQFLILTLAAALFFKSMFYTPRYSAEINKKVLNKTPQFKKLIYFVIDGLRYDALVDNLNSTQNYHNNYDFSYAHDQHLFFAVAGIPTATSCRILSMMTGKPSNQMDYLLAFFHTKNDGDSLIEQAIEHGRTMFHYGDKMWTDMFQGVRKCTCNFCPYGKELLFEKEQSTYELFMEDPADPKETWPRHEINFVHMISVDALGHSTCDINHQWLKDRNELMNLWVREMYEKMDEDTLLLVTSDHGVTDHGEHAGTTDAELASFCLFLLKKKITLNPENILRNDTFNSKLYSNVFISDYKVMPQDIIHQDDILNTVCYMMGLSIPINSCGSVINKFDTKNTTEECIEIKIRVAKDNNVGGVGFRKFMTNFKNSKIDSLKTSKNILKYSHWLSKKIKHELFRCNYFLAGVSILLQVFSFYMAYKKAGISIADIPCMIFLCMDSISFWAFACRDLYLSALFAAYCRFDPNILLCLLFYFKQPKYKHWEILRAIMGINKRICISEEAIIGLFLFVYGIRQVRRKGIQKVLSHDYILCMCVEIINKFGSLIIPATINSINESTNNSTIEENIQKISTFPNVYALLSVFFTRSQTILLIFIELSVKQLLLTKSNKKLIPMQFMILSQLLSHLINFDMQINKLDHNVAFVFQESVDVGVVTFGYLCYFLLGRYFIIFKNLQKMQSDQKIRNKIANKMKMYGIFMLSVSSFSAFVMHGEFVWIKFFADRYIIVLIQTMVEYYALNV